MSRWIERRTSHPQISIRRAIRRRPVTPDGSGFVWKSRSWSPPCANHLFRFRFVAALALIAPTLLVLVVYDYTTDRVGTARTRLK